MLFEYIHHSGFSMLLAVCWFLVAQYVEGREPHAGGMRAPLVGYVYHSGFSMLLAVRWCFAAQYIKGRLPRAGVT